MRPQQQAQIEALLSAFNGDAFVLSAECLPLADVLECAKAALADLRMKDCSISRNTFEGWVRQGVINAAKADRKQRNRYYSAADVVRLVAVVRLFALGLDARLAGELAESIIKAMQTEWFLRASSLVDDLEKHIETLDGRDISFASPDLSQEVDSPGRRRIEIVSPSADDPSLASLAVTVKASGVAVIVDARSIAYFSIVAVRDWRERKLRDFKGLLEAEKERRKKRGSTSAN